MGKIKIIRDFACQIPQTVLILQSVGSELILHPLARQDLKYFRMSWDGLY